MVPETFNQASHREPPGNNFFYKRTLALCLLYVRVVSSYFSTVRKHSMNLMESIRATFSGVPVSFST